MDEQSKSGHVWLSAEYSVPRAGLCYRARKSKPEQRCCKPVGHKDGCAYRAGTSLRSHSHREPQP